MDKLVPRSRKKFVIISNTIVLEMNFYTLPWVLKPTANLKDFAIYKINLCELNLLVLAMNHLVATGGHFGPNKTYCALSQTYYWPHMFKQVKQFTQSCDTCQKCKTCAPDTDGLLKPLDVPKDHWSSVSLDFVTG